MTELGEAVDDLGPLLITVAALIAEADTDGDTGRSGKPSSSPPWNAACATAFYDAHAEIRDIEMVFRHAVTGRYATRRAWSDGNTFKALDAIVNLSHAVAHTEVKRAARDLAHCVAVIQALTAIDEAERAQKVDFQCPYCPGHVMLLWPREGKVACLYGHIADGVPGCCRDSNGQPPKGWVRRGRLGDERIEWADGLVR